MNIIVSETNDVVLGEPFFKNNLIAFDMDTLKVGIVKLKLKLLDKIKFNNNYYYYFAMCIFLLFSLFVFDIFVIVYINHINS